MFLFLSLTIRRMYGETQLFKLDSQLRPTVIAGVPPDYFSATGQLWGNPLYDWGKMREDGFEWWINRIKAILRFVDVIRLDHSRGFAACWEVPAGNTTAEHGRWFPAPGKEFFDALKEALGDLPIIAEDLGVITPDVEKLRDDYEFPGMRILQFAFSDDTKISIRHTTTPATRSSIPAPTTTIRLWAGLTVMSGKAQFAMLNRSSANANSASTI